MHCGFLKKAVYSKIDIFVKFQSAIFKKIMGSNEKIEFFLLVSQGPPYYMHFHQNPDHKDI